jgi:hypothetical protein
MLSFWLSLPAFLAINLGFAGLLGTLIYYIRSQANSRQVAAAIALGGLVMLPPLSLPPLSQWFSWFAAILVVVLFALRPAFFPPQVWTLRFAYRYTALTMALVALWGFSTGLIPPLYVLGVLALLAGALAWHRSSLSLNGQ